MGYIRLNLTALQMTVLLQFSSTHESEINDIQPILHCVEQLERIEIPTCIN
jgi:hypothetical protein